jgi:Flp pilus assembly protein TadG
MTALHRLKERMSGRDEGLSTLELTVVFPALFLVVLFIIYVCQYEYATQVALAAASEGTRVAAVAEAVPGTTHAQAVTAGLAAADAYVRSVGGASMNGVSAVEGTDPPGTAVPAPGQIQITVWGDVTPLTSTPPLHLSQTAIVSPEVFSHG